MLFKISPSFEIYCTHLKRVNNNVQGQCWHDIFYKLQTFWWRHIKQCSWQLSADFVGSSDRVLKSFWERVFLQRLQLTFLHSKPVTNYKRDILVHQQANLFPRKWHPIGLVGPTTVDQILWGDYNVSVLYFRFNAPAELYKIINNNK